jgi:Na+/H+-dicarboxylate symporter
MATVKKQWDNDQALEEELTPFVRQTLEKGGLPAANAFNSTNLVRTLARLMGQKNATFVGVSVETTQESVVVRLVSDGTAYNPLEDLDLRALMDSDPPLPEEDFDAPQPREQILKALRNRLSYCYRNHHNEITYVARRSQPRTLKLVTYSVIAAIAIGLALRFLGSEGLQTAATGYILTPLRTIFLNALKMLVVPVVFLSIASSVAGVSDVREYGRIGGKVLLFYVSTSLVAIGVGMLVYALFRPGANVTVDLTAYSYDTATTGDISLVDTLVNIVPTSFVGAFTDTQMLPIIFLAILVGVAAVGLDNAQDRQKIQDMLGLLNRLFLKIASLVMHTIPLATFCAMTLLVLTVDTSMLTALLKLVLGMLAGVVCMFLFYSLVFFLFVRENPGTFLRKCLPNFISFVTFCSTSAVMSQSLDTCTHRLGISPKISSFSMPLGSTVNMDGACVYLTMSVLFLAAVYHVPVTVGVLVKLAVTILILSMGAPPIAGAGFICLSLLALQLGIPMEGLGILMGIDQIMSMCRTLINGTGDFAGTAVVANSEGLLDKTVFRA